MQEGAIAGERKEDSRRSCSRAILGSGSNKGTVRVELANKGKVGVDVHLFRNKVRVRLRKL